MTECEYIRRNLVSENVMVFCRYCSETELSV